MRGGTLARMRFLGELAEAAQAAPDARELRRWVLERLRRVAGFDSAAWAELAPPRISASVNKEEFLHLHQRIVVDPARYAPGLRKCREWTRAVGAVVDTEVYSARERRTLPFFVDVLRPQKISSQIIAAVSFRGAHAAQIYLCRHGRASSFGAREVGRVVPLLSAIGLAQAAFAALPAVAVGGDLLGRLAPREREIVRWVCRGLRNRDIAAVLGTSPNTVRNQLQQIFRKVDAESRTELAATFTRAGLLD